MKRFVSMEEISDVRLYGADDMVRAGCGGCEGCSACCETMADTIFLDPLDVFRMMQGLDRSFASLMADRIQLDMADCFLLPRIKTEPGQSRCPFLNEAGRCSIHRFRPGFCRLFPLGRFYENRSFRYFLQTGECRLAGRTKVKVRKWIDTPDLERYETFVSDWHYLLRDLEASMAPGDAGTVRRTTLALLETFYAAPYRLEEDFYPQFYERFLAFRKQQPPGAPDPTADASY